MASLLRSYYRKKEKKTFLKGIMPLDLLIARCRYCLVSILFCKKLTRVGQKSLTGIVESKQNIFVSPKWFSDIARFQVS